MNISCSHYKKICRKSRAVIVANLKFLFTRIFILHIMTALICTAKYLGTASLVVDSDNNFGKQFQKVEPSCCNYLNLLVFKNAWNTKTATICVYESLEYSTILTKTCIHVSELSVRNYSTNKNEYKNPTSYLNPTLKHLSSVLRAAYHIC